MIYDVRQTTSYTYASRVGHAHHVLRLTPIDRTRQPVQATALEVEAAENLKRVRRAPAAEPDWSLDPGLDRMTAFLETKTVWHPIGV